MITDRLDLSIVETQDPAFLRDLDEMLARRAAAVEDELREIGQVRKRIEGLLSPAARDLLGSSTPPGSGGATLGQTI
jgi:hypothetical protein